jgi:hypothetical protein
VLHLELELKPYCVGTRLFIIQGADEHGDTKDKTIALNARLKPGESTAHPRATNYTNVGVAQGIAYLDFGFIEPTLLAAIAKTAKDGQAAPKGLEGALVTRVAMVTDKGVMSCNNIFLSRTRHVDDATRHPGD